MGYSLWGSKELDMMSNFDSHFFCGGGALGLEAGKVNLQATTPLILGS